MLLVSSRPGAGAGSGSGCGGVSGCCGFWSGIASSLGWREDNDLAAGRAREEQPDDENGHQKNPPHEERAGVRARGAMVDRGSRGGAPFTLLPPRDLRLEAGLDLTHLRSEACMVGVSVLL